MIFRLMKTTLLILASFLSMIGSLFASDHEYKTAEVYDSLKKQAMELKPEVLGKYGKGPVLCVLMETGYPESLVSLVAAADGTASIYFSNGGGIIGGGEQPKGKAASLALIRNSEIYIEYAKPDKNHPLPKKGNTRFYFVTTDGVMAIEAKESDFGYDRHIMSPLFHQAHELITIILKNRKSHTASGD